MTAAAYSDVQGPDRWNRGKLHRLPTKSELQILSSSLPVDGGSPIAGYLAAVSPDFTWETAHHYYRTYINPALYVPFYDCACVRVLLSHVSSHLVSDKKNDA